MLPKVRKDRHGAILNPTDLDKLAFVGIYFELSLFGCGKCAKTSRKLLDWVNKSGITWRRNFFGVPQRRRWLTMLRRDRPERT
jgi:hypothetical protein